MRDTGTSERSAPGGVLTGWISRLDLALELDLTVDTLRRWEARRFGPPCVRAGRKFRHHTAERGVDICLGGYNIRQYFNRAVGAAQKGGGGIIAGAFDAKDG